MGAKAKLVLLLHVQFQKIVNGWSCCWWTALQNFVFWYWWFRKNMFGIYGLWYAKDKWTMCSQY